MRVRSSRRLAALAAVFVLATSFGLVALQQPASASATFGVMNTSETPPDGVYFRSSPQTGNYTPLYGYGVFAGEAILASCWNWGDAVGRYGNQIWYYAYNVSRPTVSGRSNEGWINTHYVDDGMNANQANPNVSQCGSNPTPPPPPPPPPPTPTPTAVAGYYSPFNLGARGDDGLVEDLRDQSGIYTANVNNWYNCSAASTTPFSALHGQLQPGQYYDRVGGWSLGRLGPAYLIQGMQTLDPNLLRQLNYIVLIDPGDYNTLNPCDIRNGSGNLYAAWLKYNTNARLVILSGTQTQTNSSKGIQEIYFNPIRNQAANTNIRSRVLTCNYKIDHYKIYDAGQYWIKHMIGANSCPTLNYNGTYWGPTAAWHP